MIIRGHGGHESDIIAIFPVSEDHLRRTDLFRHPARAQLRRIPRLAQQHHLFAVRVLPPLEQLVVLLGEGLSQPPGHLARGTSQVSADGEVLKIIQKIASRLVAVLRIPGQGSQDNGVQRGGDLVVELRRGLDLGLAHHLHGDDFVFALEQPVVGQALPEHRPGGKNIRTVVDGVGLDLLWRHVTELALDAPGLGLGQAPHCLGDAEVDELHHAEVRDQDVLGAHVPVDNVHGFTTSIAAGVGVLQCLACLGDDLEHDVHRHGRSKPPVVDHHVT